MDNQFLSTPLLREKNKVKSAREKLQKDDLIRGLELKNNKLRAEIIKIQNVIDQSLREQPQDKNKQRQSIMKTDQNNQSLTRELLNAYKKIKMYEYEISRIEDLNSDGNFVQKSKQIEAIIKEKKAISDRLRAKLQEEQKIVNDNIKKLNNNNKQNEIEKKIKTLSDELKFLREKDKEQQQKDQIRQSNMKKQYEFIKRLENQLLDMEVSAGEIEEIKQRVIKKFNPQVSESQVTKNNPKEEIEEPIQDRTIDNYRQLQAEIKLLEKLQTDYQKKLIESETEKEKAVRLNENSRDRLLEIEDEIEKLEKQILIQKGKVIPSNLKPLRPLRSVSSQMGSEKQKKILVKNVIAKSSKTLAHILKYDEVGMASDKGQRFTDRNLLGKKNLHSKIVGISVFINNQTGAIGGLQALYNNKKGGEYLRKDREIREHQYREEKISCGQGEWIKSITGTLSQQDKLQSINVITNQGQSKRFGQVKTVKKAFSLDIGPDEIPVCIFGSLVVFKEPGKPEFSLVEHFGIQVNSQHVGKAENSYDVLDL